MDMCATCMASSPTKVNCIQQLASNIRLGDDVINKVESNKFVGRIIDNNLCAISILMLRIRKFALLFYNEKSEKILQ